MKCKLLPVKPVLWGLTCILLFGGFIATNPAQDSPPAQPLNVLFIAVDDLRPQLGAYGNKLVKSPNIDRLAASGLLFERAYCQQAVCSPSRTSLLTGLRPDSTHVYDLVTHFRNTVPNVVTLPQHFKNNGYQTAWWGKIYHAGLLDNLSWTQQGHAMEPGNNWRAYVTDENKKLASRNKGAGPAFEMANVPDNAYPDGQIAEKAIQTMRQLNGKPFFMAVGFFKPHLPFNAPKKYWDLYNPADFTLPAHTSPPQNAPAMASTGWGELRNYAGIPAKGPVSDEQARQLIHGYYACVSYTDAQIGKVLDELKQLGLDKNTVVVLWGDHGWKLGEYGQWAKHTNFEIDTRVPLIVSAPGMKARGKQTGALVELVDIYPFLCDAAGLPKPTHLQGTSFAPLLSKPAMAWKKAAFSQYPRGGGVMGYSMRTERYRYTKWLKSDGTAMAIELYDLQKDPQATINVAEDATYAPALPELEVLFAARRKAS
jgi:iduronate 2-sulfatase